MTRRTIRPALAIAAALAALALAACGEKSEPDLTGTVATTTSTAPPPAPVPIGTRTARLAKAGAGTAGPIAGDWRGTLHQKGDRPFPIRVSIESLRSPRRNVVHYGGRIDCSGTWRFLSGRGTEVHFHEVIDRRSGKGCKGEGTVSLRSPEPHPSRLAYGFSGGGIESFGAIQRR